MMRDLDLHVAVCFGDISRVQDILQRGNSSINEKNCQGNSPLHMVYHGTTESVQDNDRLLILSELLRHGADVNARGRWNETPLHVAVRKLQIDAVKLLLENNADPNARDDDGRTALHSALVTMAGSESIVRLLLQHGADANAVDITKKTALIYAAKMDRLELVRALVEEGARVNFKPETKCGYPALFYACRSQNAEMIEYLLKRGADPNVRERRMGMTALHELASSWREHRDPEETWRSTEASARLLLEHGVDVDARDCEDMTALHLAAYSEDEGLVRLLLEAGARVSAKDSYGDTPMHQLLDKECDNSRHERIARFLVEEYGADAVARNGKGQTPFHLAVRLDSASIVNFMLAKISGLDEAILRNETSLRQWCLEASERTVDYELSVATILGYEHVVDRLIDSGYDIEASCETLYRGDVKTPLYYAVKARRFRIAKMLLEAGCEVDSSSYIGYGSTALHVAVFDAKDLELTCLLMEYGADVYKEDVFGKNALTYILESVITTSKASELLYLLLYYYIMDVYLNRIHSNVISNYTKLIDSNEQLLKIFSHCRGVLDDLKQRKINNDISMFDIINKNLDMLVKFLGDERNCDAITNMTPENKIELESCKYIIKVRAELALEKRKFLNNAKHFLDCTLTDVLKTINYKSLPDKIVWNILDYLNMRELKKLKNYETNARE